jgi:hypothetical protein
VEGSNGERVAREGGGGEKKEGDCVFTANVFCVWPAFFIV